MVPMERIELSASSLPRTRSTTELQRHFRIVSHKISLVYRQIFGYYFNDLLRNFKVNFINEDGDNMRILVVEDDLHMSNHIVEILKTKNFMCECINNGSDALCSIKTMKYDLILLDIGLPKISGSEILAKIRNINISTPVIIVSAISNIKSKINSLELGADDYILKPFDKREIIARIQSVKRRCIGFSSSLISYGNVVLNLAEQTIFIDGKEVHFTKKEYIMLELLITRKGSLVCKDVFLDNLYNSACDEPSVKIVDVFACKLRKKLKKHNANVIIKTIWSRGCSLELIEDQEIEDNYKGINYEEEELIEDNRIGVDALKKIC